jgi:hypothetical protein
MSLRILKRVLVISLSNKRPKLAERIAGLDEGHLHILYDHLLGQRWAEGEESGQPGLTAEELEAFAEACQSYQFPTRLLHSFRDSLVHVLRDFFPGLAGKLSRMSDIEFEWLYQQVTGRRKGTF